MSRKRTYIAAPYGDRVLVAELAEIMEDHGYSVQTRWYTNHVFEHPGELENPFNHEYAAKAAWEDVSDILAADLVVVIDHGIQTATHGRQVEFGIAIGTCNEVWWVGPWDNIFCALNGLQPNGCLVRNFLNIPDLLNYLDHDEVLNGGNSILN